jgi:acyl-CoA reductase-like NAD-dependent aldehyde dehydrogenase
VGPVINEAAAARIEQWITNAVDQGADMVAGGSRDGTLIQPTVFLQATGDMLICQQEAFGPIVAITPCYDVDQAVWTVHDMEYGLQTSLFTNDLALVMRAYEQLDVGTVLVNHLPTFSVETLPHGGKKNSSFGRESITDSMKMMTEEKLLLIRTGGAFGA